MASPNASGGTLALTNIQSASASGDEATNVIPEPVLFSQAKVPAPSTDNLEQNDSLAQQQQMHSIQAIPTTPPSHGFNNTYNVNTQNPSAMTSQKAKNLQNITVSQHRHANTNKRKKNTRKKNNYNYNSSYNYSSSSSSSGCGDTAFEDDPRPPLCFLIIFVLVLIFEGLIALAVEVDTLLVFTDGGKEYRYGISTFETSYFSSDGDIEEYTYEEMCKELDIDSLCELSAYGEMFGTLSSIVFCLGIFEMFVLFLIVFCSPHSRCCNCDCCQLECRCCFGDTGGCCGGSCGCDCKGYGITVFTSIGFVISIVMSSLAVAFWASRNSVLDNPDGFYLCHFVSESVNCVLIIY